MSHYQVSPCMLRDETFVGQTFIVRPINTITVLCILNNKMYGFIEYTDTRDVNRAEIFGPAQPAIFLFYPARNQCITKFVKWFTNITVS